MTSPVAADGPVINVDEGDDPLVIRGILTGATGSFSGNVRITVTGGGTTDLRLLATDLTHNEDSTYDIDRTNISIPGGTSFTENQPRDVRVTVNNVTRPGVYEGDLLFYLAEHENPEEDGRVVPLELHIDAAPSVTPVEASRSIQVVRCYTAADCLIARLLLPASVVDDEWAIQLDNKTVQPVQVTDFAVLMDGDNTHQVLRSTQVSADVPIEMPASDVTTIDLEIDRVSLPSDRYQGSLRFGLEGADTPVSVTVDLSVRDGPFWPLVVTLLGILGGRLMRQLSTAEAQKQRELVVRYAAVEAKAAKIKDPEAKAQIREQLGLWKDRLDKDEDTQKLELDLTKIEGQIDSLLVLEDVENKVAAGGFDSLLLKLEPTLTAARKAALEGNVEEARRLQEAAEQEWQKAARADGSMSGLVDELGRIGDAWRDSTDRMRAGAGTDTGPTLLLRLIGWLGGARVISTEVEWIMWQVFSFVFLVALVLVGLKSLYVNAGATFGATGLYDYLGLLLWGFSSTVAQKTLQNLAVP
jgi:hypothetical protein